MTLETVFLGNLIDNMADGFFVIDGEGRFKFVNAPYCSLCGYQEEELLVKNLPDILQEDNQIDLGPIFQRGIKNGKVRFEMIFRNKFGDILELGATGAVFEENGEELLGVMVYNLIEVREAERYADAGKTLGKLFSEASSRKVYLDLARDLICSWSGCNSVGIRVLNEEKAIPFESAKGYNQKFIESENWLFQGQDQCLCTRVSLQQFFERDAALKTLNGSIYCNKFSEFISCLSGNESKCYRGTCGTMGYESLAVVPIRYNNKVLGIVHIADKKPNMLSAKTVEFLETIAPHVGAALHRFNVEDELQRHNDTLGAMARLMSLAMENVSLEEIIGQTLDSLLSISWLSFEARGRIYLVEDEPDRLILKVKRGYEGASETSCGTVDFGDCLCGEAALNKKIVFTSSHEGEFPHGHYIVPIVFEGKVLGVINISVREGHRPNKKEELFLTAIANTLAGIIVRKQTEAEIVRSYNQKKHILEAMGEGIFGVDINGHTVFLNPAATMITGYEAEDLIGRNQHEITHHTKTDGTPYPKEECPILRTLESGVRQQAYDELFWKKDGMPVPVEYICTPVVENGQTTGAVVVFKDITEHKRAQAALVQNEERYRSLVRQSSEGIFTFDPQTRKIQEANPQFMDMLGYTEEELKGLLLDDILLMQKDFIKANIQKAIDDGQVIAGPRQYRRKDGTIQDADITGSLISFGDAQVLMINVRDVSERRKAEEALRKSFEDLTKTLEETVNALAAMSEKRDPYTAGHQRRVAKLAVAIAREMGLNKEQLQAIHIAGILHDIGKIYVPTEILNKPGRLTEIEMSLIKTHSEVGYEILKSIPFSYPVANIVLQHHERVDGSGYPAGLKGEEIVIEAKILAVADVVEAIASHRPYRPSLGLEIALQELRINVGTFYDQDVVIACINLITLDGFEIGT